MAWTVKEENRDSIEAGLVISKDGVVKGLVDVTLYSNGPCVKYMTAMSMEDGPPMTQFAIEYLQDHYGYPYGVFAYVYSYKEYERHWLEAAGLKLLNNLDDGARLLFKLDPPMVN